MNTRTSPHRPEHPPRGQLARLDSVELVNISPFHLITAEQNLKHALSSQWNCPPDNNPYDDQVGGTGLTFRLRLMREFFG